MSHPKVYGVCMVLEPFWSEKKCMDFNYFGRKSENRYGFSAGSGQNTSVEFSGRFWKRVLKKLPMVIMVRVWRTGQHSPPKMLSGTPPPHPRAKDVFPSYDNDCKELLFGTKRSTKIIVILAGWQLSVFLFACLSVCFFIFIYLLLFVFVPLLVYFC